MLLSFSEPSRGPNFEILASATLAFQLSVITAGLEEHGLFQPIMTSCGGAPHALHVAYGEIVLERILGRSRSVASSVILL